MKRFLTKALVATLMLTTLAGCSKKEKGKENTPDNATTAPTISVEQPGDITYVPIESPEYIALGGYFSKDYTNVSIYISEEGWQISGIYFPQTEGASLLTINGPMTYKDGLDLHYDDGENALTFTFDKFAMTAKVTKGTAFTDFAGKYRRVDDTVAAPGPASPEKGSTLEVLGQVAATHYMVKTEGIPQCTFDISANTFDNDYMHRFLGAYSDLFLSTNPEPVPELSTKYLCGSISKENLDKVLLTASNGTFGVKDLVPDGTTVLAKDDTYYIVCQARYSGALTTEFTDTNPETINEKLQLHAMVAKLDGTNYDVEMTLSTKTAGDSVLVTSVTYKLVQ